MKSRTDAPRPTPHGPTPRRWSDTAAGRALPGLVLAGTGIAMLWIARGQPVWLGADAGPGLMAQLLGKGVIALGLVFALLRALRPDDTCTTGCGTGDGKGARRLSGPALLGAVLAFALTMPLTGLVTSATLAAALASWGAGERSPVALALTAAALGTLTAGIGLALLPPTAPLWPAFL
jgi:hypothetical protein